MTDPGRTARRADMLPDSSRYSAQLATALGLPFACASRFAPDHRLAALELNRHWVMVGLISNARYAPCSPRGAITTVPSAPRTHKRVARRSGISHRPGRLNDHFGIESAFNVSALLPSPTRSRPSTRWLLPY